MDNAFLSPIVSALGRSFLSKRNRRNSASKKNVQRIGFLLFVAFGFWLAAFGGLLCLGYQGIRGIPFGYQFQAISVVCSISGLIIFGMYRNAYVEITRSYVLRRNLFRFVEKIEYRRIRKYGFYERYDHENNFEEGLQLGGPLIEGHKYSAESVLLYSNWANYSYVLGQLAFRILNERWAEPDSDEDQKLIQEYVSSGRARELCLEYSGTVFPENDNSPYQK